MNEFIEFCFQGKVAEVDRLLKEKRVDPSIRNNWGIQVAAREGHLSVVDRLLQEACVDPSANENLSVQWAAYNDHLAVVEILLQDKRVDPSANDNRALQLSAFFGHFYIVERLLKDKRVDPSAAKNYALRWAFSNAHFKVVDRLLDDERISLENFLEKVLPNLPVGDRKKAVYFEYRGRFTEICIALQSMQLPAWITMLILKASYPWNTLPIHKRWALVCTVKHFKCGKPCIKNE
jgi:ankyrin repeat protein